MMYCTHTMVMYRWQNKLYLTMCTTATWSFLYNKSLRISIAINSTERCIYTPWIEQLIDLDTTPESKLKESPLSKFKSTFKSRIFFPLPLSVSQRWTFFDATASKLFRTFVHLVSQFSRTVVNRPAFRPLRGGGKGFLAHVCCQWLTQPPPTRWLRTWSAAGLHSVAITRFFSAAAIICYPGLFKAHLAVEKLKVEMALIKRSWERQKQNVYSLKTQIKPTCFGQWP